jgi:hypothetical protein
MTFDVPDSLFVVFSRTGKQWGAYRTRQEAVQCISALHGLLVTKNLEFSITLYRRVQGRKG